MKIDIIDAHSHVGNDFLGVNCPIEEYLTHATKLNVKKTLLMPVPTPIIEDKAGVHMPCIWEIKDNKQVHYFKKDIGKDRELSQENPPNPYAQVNHELLNNISLWNMSQKGIKFHGVPLIHPKLDTKEEIEKIISNNFVYAIKVHGIATFTSPADIGQEICDIIKKYNKPLIVHTDYCDGEMSTMLQQLLRKNNPVDRVRFGIEKGIKIFITHAGRLSKEAVDLAKLHKNIGFGMGPDLLLGHEKKGLYDKDDNVMGRCINNIPSNQLMFDIDYGRNVSMRGEWKNKNRGCAERLLYEGYKKGLTERGIYSILYENANFFFGL